VGIYIWAEKKKGQSLEWLDLEGANSDTSLADFANAHPDTRAGKVAEMHRARYLLGPEGVDKLPIARDEAERKKAIKNVETARDLMAKLADQFPNDTALKTECYLGLAKAEGALVGIPKEGSPTEQLGSIDKMTEWLDKVGMVAAGTPWADEAKKTADAMKNPATREKFKQLQEQVYAKPFELLPGTGPRPPIGSEFPGITPPGIPGISGGPSTPSLPGPKPPEPPAPKPPSTSTTPTPALPAPKPPEPPVPKVPSSTTPGPAPIPAPKPDGTAPKAPEPKAPAPKPPAPPAPKAPEPPKK
jgi:hypothetical protein